MQQQSIRSSKYNTSDHTINMDLEENDPALEQLFEIVADMPLPLEIRRQKNGKTLNDTGIMEMLRLRVMVTNSREKDKEEIKLQLTSQEDLFFNFICLVNKKEFNKLKRQQNLTIGFQNFVQMVTKLTKMVHTQKNTHFAILCIKRDNSAHLDFNESVGYKFIEVLSLSFSEIDVELNKQIVSFRFNLVKRRLQVLNNSLRQVSGMIKVKNPSIFQKVSKKPNSES